jgi:hypothetical protein
MKSILLKLDDKLFEELEASAKEEKTPKTTYIKRAIEAYTKSVKRKRLEEQIKREVEIIKQDKEGWKEFKEWETSSLTDLNKYLDNMENGQG